MLRAGHQRPLVAYFEAIKNLRVRQLALILKSGYDPNLMLNARGLNGLQYLVAHFGATEARLRLQAPVSRAAYLATARLLLDAGLDPNAAELISGESALFDAIRLDERPMVALLLNYADLALRNKDGETALMCAARCGSRQVMRMLLEHLRQLQLDGYFLRQRNRLGLTALELARAENLEAAKVLTRHLVAFGQRPLLARSSSQHALAAMAPYYGLGYGPGRAGRVPAAAAVGVGEDSDGDLSEGPGGGLGYLGAPEQAQAAAQFSRYLLERHGGGAAAGAGSGSRADYAAANSDDELELGLGLGGGGALGLDPDDPDESGGYLGCGPLARSRSCAQLGPGRRGEAGRRAEAPGPSGGGGGGAPAKGQGQPRSQ